MLVYDSNNNVSDLLITVARLNLFDIPLSFFFFFSENHMLRATYERKKNKARNGNFTFLNLLVTNSSNSEMEHISF